MWETLQTLLSALGALIVAGGSIAAAAFALFKFFGERWLDAKFRHRLEAFKHDQQKELEHLRYKINALFDRKTKLNQREFEIMPEIWSHSVEAHAVVASFVSSMQQYPNVEKMNIIQLDEFLRDSDLLGWQKLELKNSPDKNDYYQNAIFGHRSDKCREACRTFHRALRQKGIFLDDAIRHELAELDSIVWDALIEHEANEEYKMQPRVRKANERFNEEAKPLMNSIEAKIRDRLWND